MPTRLETAIYRIVQEALHNVAKHANATTVIIEMGTREWFGAPAVEDDGIGIAAQEPNPGPADLWHGRECANASATSEER